MEVTPSDLGTRCSPVLRNDASTPGLEKGRGISSPCNGQQNAEKKGGTYRCDLSGIWTRGSSVLTHQHCTPVAYFNHSDVGIRDLKSRRPWAECSCRRKWNTSSSSLTGFISKRHLTTAFTLSFGQAHWNCTRHGCWLGAWTESWELSDVSANSTAAIFSFGFQKQKKSTPTHSPWQWQLYCLPKRRISFNTRCGLFQKGVAAKKKIVQDASKIVS
jgi:hypothetical protein